MDRGLAGKSGELPGNFGQLPGNLWIAVKFHSERTSGEVAEKPPGKSGELREVRGLSRSSGEPDSLPTTRQIRLQKMVFSSGSTRVSPAHIAPSGGTS